MDTSRTAKRRRARERFTPVLDGVADDDPLAPLTRAANDIIERSLAGGTLDNYESGWLAWEAFCAPRGLCPLPADPHHVALHLAMIGARVAEDGVACGDDGEPLPGHLRPNTVANHLTAINKAHNAAGLREPGTDETVTAVLRGLRRTFGSAPLLAKAALDLPLLERLLAVVDEPPIWRLRELALVTVTAARDLTPGQLMGLPWTAIELDDGPEVSFQVPSATRSAATVSVVLQERPDDPACPVAALRSLRRRSPEALYVFEDPTSHRPMSRQGIALALKRLTGGGGLDPLSVRRIVKGLWAPTLRQLRDRALLLVGWYAALRRSNLVWAIWGDLRAEESYWELTLRRSKTNGDGARNEKNWLIRSDGDWPCPAAALDAWRRAMIEVLDVTDEEFKRLPLFVQIHKSGNIKLTRTGTPQALSGDAVCDLIQDLAGRAGLNATDFGGHSIRAGFITEALNDDKMSLTGVQTVSHHLDVNSIHAYHRVVNGRTNHPIRALYAQPKPGTAGPQDPEPTATEIRRRRRQSRMR